jgi:hypothetical protein
VSLIASWHSAWLLPEAIGPEKPLKRDLQSWKALCEGSRRRCRFYPSHPDFARLVRIQLFLDLQQPYQVCQHRFHLGCSQLRLDALDRFPDNPRSVPLWLRHPQTLFTI